MSQKAKWKASAAGSQEPPARARVEPDPDPDAIRDSLLGTIAIRAKALRSFAERASADGVIGWTDDDPPKPIMFPAAEVVQYLGGCNGAIDGEIRHLRELGKLSPAERDAAVDARRRLRDAGRGGE